MENRDTGNFPLETWKDIESNDKKENVDRNHGIYTQPGRTFENKWPIQNMEEKKPMNKKKETERKGRKKKIE